MKHSIKHMILSALCLALALILPFITGQIQAIGNMLCPMHIAIFICAYVTDWKWATIIGFIAPIFRSLIFGMPLMFPSAIAMSFELATYGLIAGLLNEKLNKTNINVYISLITAMIVGRLIWGIVSIPLYGLAGKEYSLSIFLAGAFTNAIPGIILHIILIPILIMSLRKAKIIDNAKGRN